MTRSRLEPYIMSMSHLLARQLAAFAGLGALRDLDLQLVRIHQELGSHAEAPACHLQQVHQISVRQLAAVSLVSGGLTVNKCYLS